MMDLSHVLRYVTRFTVKMSITNKNTEDMRELIELR